MTPIEDPPHSTGEPVYRDLLHGLPGQAGVAQNFDGNGPSVRYHAGFGDRTVASDLPGAGEQIFGLTSEPIIGSRPKFTNQLPPFRPDVPCTDAGPAQPEGRDRARPRAGGGQHRPREAERGAAAARADARAGEERRRR